MSRRRRALALALLLSSSPMAVRALAGLPEGPFLAGPALSVETVLELARAKAPAIAAARARVLQAQGRAVTATRLPDPELAYGAGRGRPSPDGSGGAEWSFEVSQSLPAPWGLSARRRLGTATVEAARREEEAVAVEVLFEAKRLYYEAALGAARARALATAAEDARSLRDLVARRVEVGESPGGDLLRTEVETLRAESEALAASAEAEGARAALGRFLLGALDAHFTLPDDLDPGAVPAAPDDAVAIAVSRNPLLRAADSRIEASRSLVAAERAARLPALGISLFRESEIDRDATGGTLGFTIPLWNRNRGALAVAHAELAEAEASAGALRVAIEGDVERALWRDRAARDVAIAYRRRILPAASDALSTARFSLEQGEASLLVWLEARRSYLEVLRASYEAHLTAFLTRAELERLTGDLDETHAR